MPFFNLFKKKEIKVPAPAGNMPPRPEKNAAGVASSKAVSPRAFSSISNPLRPLSLFNDYSPLGMFGGGSSQNLDDDTRASVPRHSTSAGDSGFSCDTSSSYGNNDRADSGSCSGSDSGGGFGD